MHYFNFSTSNPSDHSSPSIDQERFDHLLDILNDFCALDLMDPQIQAQTRIADLNLDTLDLVELSLLLEEDFDCDMSAFPITPEHTVADIFNYLKNSS